MRDFRVDDETMCTRHGECVVIHLREGDTYPVLVEYPDGEQDTYTKEGRLHTDDYLPSLFPRKGFVPASAPDPVRTPDWLEGTEVMITSCPSLNRPECRVLAGFSDIGWAECYSDGKNEWTSEGAIESWPFYRLPTADDK